MHYNPEPKPLPTCDICKEREAQAIIDGKRVCLPCFEQSGDETIRLYLASFKLVQGGLPC